MFSRKNIPATSVLSKILSTVNIHYRNITENEEKADLSLPFRGTGGIFAAMKILMVCLGNICRSPLAEGILQQKAKKAGLDWIIDSAGTNGFHIGEAPHRLSQKVALHHGIDISKQRARQFVTADFDNFDKIYAMAEEVVDEMKWISKNKFNAAKTDLLMNEVSPGKNKDVPDPWYGPEPGYHEVYEMIEAACDKIIEKAKGV